MSRRARGLTLLLMFVVALAALAQDYRFDLLLAEQRTVADNVLRTIESVQLELADLRAAEASYLNADQGPGFWMQRAIDVDAQVERAIAGLPASMAADEARSHVEAASAALGGLASLDQKAREDVARGEHGLASDLLFTDGLEAARHVSTELTAAENAELTAIDARLADTRRWRLGVNGSALAVVVTLGLLLLRVRREPDGVVSAPEEAASVPAAAPAPGVRTSTAPVVPPVSVPSGSSLADAADVCVDLARLLDSRDVQPLFDRAARVLSARGLVLWVASSNGTLMPSLVHGYSERVLQQLGPLAPEADNVTSLAFRSMTAQTMSGPSAGATGAIAVPLISSTGCVGVLAAEVSGAESTKDTVSLARMIAAQLATVIPPAADQAAAEAVQA
jgi:hypothetical protein